MCVKANKVLKWMKTFVYGKRVVYSIALYCNQEKKKNYIRKTLIDVFKNRICKQHKSKA